MTCEIAFYPVLAVIKVTSDSHQFCQPAVMWDLCSALMTFQLAVHWAKVTFL